MTFGPAALAGVIVASMVIWQVWTAFRLRSGYRELHRERQGTRFLVVREKGRVRQLVQEGETRQSIQTSMTTDGTLVSTSIDPFAVNYADAMHLTSVFVPAPRRLLFLGAGGGVLPQQCAARFPGSRVDVVDLDGPTLALAEKYFGLVPDERTSVHTADALEFLRSSPDGVYDWIHVDLFNLGAIPHSIRSAEFFSLLQQKLADGGVVAMNVIGSYSGTHARVVEEMFGRFRDTFGVSRSFRLGIHHPVEAGLAVVLARFTPRNFILFGGRMDAPDEATLRERVAALKVPMLPGAFRQARRLAGQLRVRRRERGSGSAL